MIRRRDFCASSGEDRETVALVSLVDLVRLLESSSWGLERIVARERRERRGDMVTDQVETNAQKQLCKGKCCLFFAASTWATENRQEMVFMSRQKEDKRESKKMGIMRCKRTGGQ